MQELQYAAGTGRQLSRAHKAEKGASRSDHLFKLWLQNAHTFEKETG
jgi:hypothetical protein